VTNDADESAADRPRPTATWEGVFDESYDDLLWFGRLLTGDLYAAEDLVQEAFVRTARHIPGYTHDHAKSYVRKAMVNLWRNRARRLTLERGCLEDREQPAVRRLIGKHQDLGDTLTDPAIPATRDGGGNVDAEEVRVR
jgi:DNA-directed RNA polymerase specialized sigma24 family protein